MMVVEDMDSSPPRKMPSMVVQPINWATMMPRMNMPTLLTIAMVMAALPTLTSFLKLNSSPRANRRKMIPISDHWFTAS